MAKSDKPAPKAKESGQRSEEAAKRLIDYFERVGRFQGSYLTRVASYVDRLGNLAGGRVTDPGQWIGAYASFVSRLADDWGDWILDRDGPLLPQVDAAVPLYTATLKRDEGNVSIKIRVLPNAFEKDGKMLDSVTLTSAGLVNRLGGEGVPAEHLRFMPAPDDGNVSKTATPTEQLMTGPITPANPFADLRIFDVRKAALEKQGSFVGTVWAKQTEVLVAVIQVTVS